MVFACVCPDFSACIWESKCKPVHVLLFMFVCTHVLTSGTRWPRQSTRSNYTPGSRLAEFSCCECGLLESLGWSSNWSMRRKWCETDEKQERKDRCVSENAQSGRARKCYNSCRARQSYGVEWCWKCQDGTVKTVVSLGWMLQWGRGHMQEDRSI